MPKSFVPDPLAEIRNDAASAEMKKGAKQGGLGLRQSIL